MKKIKWSSIIIAICYIAAGIMFFANASLTKEIICTWMGWGLIISGLILIVSYLIRPKQESFFIDDFSDGLMYATLGALALVKKPIFLGVIYFAIAIIIMISGFKKLQDCVDAWRFGAKHGVLYLVLAAISICLGLIIILDSTLSERTLHYLLGGGLLFSGVSDLVSTIFLTSKMFEYTRKVEEVTVTEEETEDTVVEEKEEILDDQNNTPEL